MKHGNAELTRSWVFRRLGARDSRTAFLFTLFYGAASENLIIKCMSLTSSHITYNTASIFSTLRRISGILSGLSPIREAPLARR